MILAIKKFLSFICLLFVACVLCNSEAQSKQLNVYSSYMDTSDLTSFYITRSFFCPPITELNLSTKKSNSVAIKSIQAVSNQDGSTVWKIHLNPNLYFWSASSPVKAEDLASFFEKRLKKIILDKIPSTQVPGFKLNVVSEYYLEILWATSPYFGPFVLNNVSIENSSECASFVKVQKVQDSDGYHIEAIKRLADGKLDESTKIRFYNKEPKDQDSKESKEGTKSGSGEENLIIKFAGQYHTHPKQRLSDEQISCKTVLELPMFTAIFWNSYDTDINENIRSSTTYMIPRGEILRAVSGSLGSLVSFPILKDHPGYNSQVKVKPYDLSLTEKQLDQIPLIRKSSSSWRKKDKFFGSEFKLRFLHFDLPESIQKILLDSFNFVGVESSFEKYDSSRPQDPKKYSGVIQSFFIDTDYDYLPYFNSKSKLAPYFIVNKSDTVLDNLLEDYSLSLTREKADFSKLQNIHKYMTDQEYLTTILQSNVCMHYGSKLKLDKKLKLNSRFFMNILDSLTGPSKDKSKVKSKAGSKSKTRS